LALTALQDWLYGNAALAAPEARKNLPPSPRRKGMKHGGKIMFLSAFLFPIFFAFCLMIDAGEPMVIPFFVFLVGFAIMLYSRLFLDATPPSQTPLWFPATQNNQSLPQGTQAGLPQGSPAGFATPSAIRTAELAPPAGSVTDHTTKLLEK